MPKKGPDFSEINTLKKAQELFQKGQMEKVHLMPLQFGGEDIPQNTLYVPVGIAAIKAGIDNNIIGGLIKDGKVSQYSASPDYQGESFIPIAINVKAWEPETFETQIKIWGDALK